jgi:hypothetical protein
LTGAAGFFQAQNILEEGDRLFRLRRDDLHMRELCNQAFDHEISPLGLLRCCGLRRACRDGSFGGSSVAQVQKFSPSSA